MVVNKEVELEEGCELEVVETEGEEPCELVEGMVEDEVVGHEVVVVVDYDLAEGVKGEEWRGVGVMAVDEKVSQVVDERGVHVLEVVCLVEEVLVGLKEGEMEVVEMGKNQKVDTMKEMMKVGMQVPQNCSYCSL